MAGLTPMVSVGLGGSLWALPSDLSGPEDQLHLEGQVDHGAQGSREHQQCPEHPVSMSRRRGHQERGQGGTDPTWRSQVQGQHSQQILWLQEFHPFQGYPEERDGVIIK